MALTWLEIWRLLKMRLTRTKNLLNTCFCPADLSYHGSIDILLVSWPPLENTELLGLSIKICPQLDSWWPNSFSHFFQAASRWWRSQRRRFPSGSGWPGAGRRTPTSTSSSWSWVGATPTTSRLGRRTRTRCTSGSDTWCQWRPSRPGWAGSRSSWRRARRGACQTRCSLLHCWIW